MAQKACIFDLDGTLLNTAVTICHFINKTFSRFGIPPITEEETMRFAGNGARVLIRRALSSKGIEDPELYERALAVYNEDYDKNANYLTKPYEGIPEALRMLRERGFSLGVISNKPEGTARAAVEHFFPGVFDEIYGAIDGVPLKPDPGRTLSLCGALGVLPQDVFYFGDTAVDIETGRALGARCVTGVLWGFRSREELEPAHPDALIRHPSEIKKIIAGCEEGREYGK